MAGSGPLDGLTIVDLTRVLSGPYCTMLLADMGARVIKVEQPGRGDDTRAWGPPFIGAESAYFLSINRNKESVTLDFKSRRRPPHPGPADRQRRCRRRELPSRCDGQARSRLRHACQTTPAARLLLDLRLRPGRPAPRPAGIRRGYPGRGRIDERHRRQPTGRPFRVGVAVTDMVAGLLAAQGIVLALFARERTGRGQQVDISMLDGVISLLSYHASIYLTTGAESRRVGNRHATIAPYDTFAASDGELFLAVGNDEQFQRFCAASGQQHLLD